MSKASFWKVIIIILINKRKEQNNLILIFSGADAYHCDKCDKKVITVKRLCVRKLPPILVIQLKRFEYDYERVCAIKFNDYFEFPRWLDMEPYTGKCLKS
jgi:ubiquitin C-terminal hydrolase